MVGAYLLSVLAWNTAREMAIAQEEGVRFSRLYKTGETESFGMVLDLTQQIPTGTRKGTLMCDVELKVVSLKQTSADVQLTTSNMRTSTGARPDAPPPATVNLAATGLPESLSTNAGNQGYTLLILCGLTPDAPVAKGQSFPFSWRDTVMTSWKMTGKGEVKSIDSAAGKVTVDWDIASTTGQANDGTLKFTSVYSAKDFGLLESEGTMGFRGGSVKFHITRHGSS